MRCLVGLTIICAVTSAALADAAQPLEPLDLAGVTAVAISGEASSIDITTAPDAPYQATLKRHRSGWFGWWRSGWAFDDCNASSRQWIEGTLLRIDVGLSPWFGGADCSTEINLNVRKQAAVAIDQPATQAKLSGDFSALTIAAKAADVAFSGHAEW